MRETSALYRQIIAGEHTFETSLVIGKDGVLIDESGDVILFGDDAILVDSGAPDDGFQGDEVFSAETTFPGMGDDPGAGGTYSAECSVTLRQPAADIPIRARLALFFRARAGKQVSEWIPNGVFYVDRRDSMQASGWKKLTLHGYDGMMLTEADYPAASGLDWPASDADVVQEISDYIGVPVDPRVWEILGSYRVPYLTGYSCREMLGYIGGIYGGNWVVTPAGALMLVTLWALPAETSLLTDDIGDVILFGEDAIIV